MTSRIDEASVAFDVKAIRVRQPIGEFLVASIPAKQLCDISYFDVRRMLKERDIETYLGIQRPLNPRRVEELQQYVRTIDACFPTAVILAIESRCASYDEESGTLTIKNDPNPEGDQDPIYYRNIAKVLDGQHRIAGLIGYEGSDFDVNVSVFIDIDIEDQAYIFSTVNLAQTKVNKSLAYDLVDLAKSSSPQKTCHNIAVALDQIPSSPFYKRIKRLGSATPGRANEMLTQATFVEALLPFITSTPTADRDLLKRGQKIAPPSPGELDRHPFRSFFINGKDLEIGDIILRYFSAIKTRWPTAWDSKEKGLILNRTNGFRAFMRALMPVYRDIRSKSTVPDQSDFASYIDRVNLGDNDFNTDNFKPGTSGEVQLLARVLSDMGLDDQKRLI